MTPLVQKSCRTCGCNKAVENFSKNRSKKDGLQDSCKLCQSARQKGRLEHARRYNRVCRQKRPGLDYERVRSWRAANPDRMSAYYAAWARSERKAPWSSWCDIDRVYREARRRTRETGQPLVVDHIYAVNGRTVCGLTCPENLRVVSSRLNASKGNKLPGFLASELWDPEGPDVFHEPPQQ